MRVYTYKSGSRRLRLGLEYWPVYLSLPWDLRLHVGRRVFGVNG